MNFEEAFAHYQAHTATAEETALVEGELEKFRLLEDYLAARELPELPEVPAGTVQAETKAVKRRMNRRTGWTVLAAVAALFCGCAVLTLKCRIPASVAPLTALSAIVAMLTLAAMAGVLYPAAWLLYLLCLAGGVWVAASCRGSTGAAQRLFIGGGFAAAAEGEAVHLVCASGGGCVNYIAHSVQRAYGNVERVVHMVAHRGGSIAVIALSVHGKVGGDNLSLIHI